VGHKHCILNFVSKPEVKKPIWSGDPEIDRRRVLKWMLRKQGMTVWPTFMNTVASYE
jgi:hypothetical protein